MKIMTYNIRLDVESDGKNAWTHRKDMLSDQILFLSPDVLGVQEARPNQMIDLDEDLENYGHFGLGRDGGEEGEHSSIFYNKETCKVTNQGTFWLSETPDEVSKGWDADYPRICTYGLFTALKSNKKFWVFNTHLDHVGEKARLNGIKLIQKRIAELNDNNYQVILMGDFNVEPDSQVIQNLTQTMTDSKKMANHTFGSNGTFTGFNVTEPATRRIDFIMISNSSDVEVMTYGVLSSLIDQRYPSDHFPVLAILQLN